MFLITWRRTIELASRSRVGWIEGSSTRLKDFGGCGRWSTNLLGLIFFVVFINLTKAFIQALAIRQYSSTLVWTPGESKEPVVTLTPLSFGIHRGTRRETIGFASKER